MQGGNARRASVLTGDCNTSSVDFLATFRGTVQVMVCATHGANDNFIDSTLLQKIETSGAQFTMEHLSPPIFFHLAGHKPEQKIPTLIGNKAVIETVEPRIRHVTALTLQNMRWLATKKCLPEPLFSRTALKTIGINTKHILQVTAEKCFRYINMNQLSHIDPFGGRAATIVSGVFYTYGDTYDESLKNEKEQWCNFERKDEMQ